MDVFTANEILFLLTGALTIAFGWILVTLIKKYRLRWYTCAVAILGCFQTLFALQWAMSSVLEGEAQAANMGLLIFGLPGLLLLGAAARMVRKDIKMEVQSKS